jgi:hypothetical protein
MLVNYIFECRRKKLNNVRSGGQGSRNKSARQKFAGIKNQVVRKYRGILGSAGG